MPALELESILGVVRRREVRRPRTAPSAPPLASAGRRRGRCAPEGSGGGGRGERLLVPPGSPGGGHPRLTDGFPPARPDRQIYPLSHRERLRWKPRPPLGNPVFRKHPKEAPKVRKDSTTYGAYSNSKWGQRLRGGYRDVTYTVAPPEPFERKLAGPPKRIPRPASAGPLGSSGPRGAFLPFPHAGEWELWTLQPRSFDKVYDNYNLSLPVRRPGTATSRGTVSE